MQRLLLLFVAIVLTTILTPVACSCLHHRAPRYHPFMDEEGTWFFFLVPEKVT